MRLLRRLARLAAGTAAALVLGACHTTPGCTSPPIAVAAPIVVNPTLVSPASGATSVSTGPLDVTIGTAFNALALFVQDGNGTVTNSTNFHSASPSGDVRIGTFTQLASHTTYMVYAIVPVFGSSSYNPCGLNPAVVAPAQTPVLLGTFTTG